MKIIEPSVEVIIPGLMGREDVYKHIEMCGRVCYKSEDKITEDSAAKFIKGIIKNGHEAVLEHFNITVKFICDRGVSHEIVRHRIASYCQESTRYCNYAKADEVVFILPNWIKEGAGQYEPIWEGCLGKHEIDPYEEGSAESWWFWHCAVSERDYMNLIRHGWTPQQARSVLPNSLKTEVVMTANIREWRHFFKLRCSKAAHPQMRQVALLAYSELCSRLPVFFEDLDICWD